MLHELWLHTLSQILRLPFSIELLVIFTVLQIAASYAKKKKKRRQEGGKEEEDKMEGKKGRREGQGEGRREVRGEREKKKKRKGTLTGMYPKFQGDTHTKNLVII